MPRTHPPRPQEHACQAPDHPRPRSGSHRPAHGRRPRRTRRRRRPEARADRRVRPAAASAPASGTGESADTCALKPKPAGKVLQGYWENWDGAVNGVHPPFGWAPIDDPRFAAHGYNVINAAFP